MAMMPFSYNIAYGILFGLIGYTVGQAATGKGRGISGTVWILPLLFTAYLICDLLL